MNSPSELAATAQSLVVAGKGLLAADESFPTIGKRFQALGIPETAEMRRGYRELLFATPGLAEFISGVILFDETIRQKIDGVEIPDVLARAGIIPGIKVDAGTTDLPGHPGEKITLGLDGLRERLAGYRKLGARFTKWRAVITLSGQLPTPACLAANARILALFASFSQEAGLVPIVEPEVLMDGDHTLARCEQATGETLTRVFDALAEQGVDPAGMLLKTGMVLAGKNSAQPSTLSDVAEATLRCLHRHVPAAVSGIVFLSGGQSDVDATARLNAICARGGTPWKLSFSYGRALQDGAMKTWRGNPARVSAAQAVLLHRARCNSRAVQGSYSADLEHATR